MIDPSTETILTLTEAARRIPGRGGRALNFSTLWRWITKGCRSPAGRLVRLRAARAGCKWITSAEALSEFFANLTPSFDAAPPPPRSAARRERESARVGAALEAEGI
jgi:hypothetical protein